MTRRMPFISLNLVVLLTTSATVNRESSEPALHTMTGLMGGVKRCISVCKSDDEATEPALLHSQIQFESKGLELIPV